MSRRVKHTVVGVLLVIVGFVAGHVSEHVRADQNDTWMSEVVFARELSDWINDLSNQCDLNVIPTTENAYLVAYRCHYSTASAWTETP